MACCYYYYHITSWGFWRGRSPGVDFLYCCYNWWFGSTWLGENLKSIKMKKQISFAIILFSSLGAFAQVMQEELEKEIKPLTQRVTTLLAENSKLKSEIGSLHSELSNARRSIDSLRTKTQNNSYSIGRIDKIYVKNFNINIDNIYAKFNCNNPNNCC